MQVKKVQIGYYQHREKTHLIYIYYYFYTSIRAIGVQLTPDKINLQIRISAKDCMA